MKISEDEINSVNCEDNNLTAISLMILIKQTIKLL